MRLVEELSQRALGRYAIAVIGEEPRLAYNRVLLSSVLAQEVSRADIELRSAGWWRDHGVTLLYGRSATAIDPAQHLVQSRRWRHAAVQQARTRHRLAAAPSQRARHGSARGYDFPRSRRCRGYREGGGFGTQGGGDRRRTARAGSGLWIGESGRAGFRHSSHGPLDGAPARRPRFRDAQGCGRGARHHRASSGRDRGHSRQYMRRSRRAQETAWKSTPVSWWSPPA